jgi:hypothetical protein
VQEAAAHHLPYSVSSTTQMLPTYHTKLNVIQLYFTRFLELLVVLFSGKGDACADEEHMDNKKGKVKM